MKPIEFPEQNAVWGKPEGWTDEECSPLPVLEGIDDAGLPYKLSVWQPSYEDIAAINVGQPICLKIISEVQIPVVLFTIDDVTGEVNP